jgi:hypothetical protein
MQPSCDLLYYGILKMEARRFRLERPLQGNGTCFYQQVLRLQVLSENKVLEESKLSKLHPRRTTSSEDSSIFRAQGGNSAGGS